MSFKNVVVEGYSWQASTTSLPGLPTNAAYTLTDVKSPKTKVDNKAFVLSTSIVIAGTDVSEQFTFAGSGVLNGSAQKFKENQIPVLLEGDSVECPTTCTNNSTGATTVGTIKIQITSAGQSVVKAE